MDDHSVIPTTGAGLRDWGVLTVEQEIRARALHAAVQLDGPTSRAAKALGWGGSPRDSALACAQVFEAYIRDGEVRVSAEERSDDTKNSPKVTEVG